jgi:hypothetical protein
VSGRVLALAVLLGLGGPARAEQSAAEIAREGARLSQQAHRLFEHGLYREAIDGFERSHRLHAHRSNLYYIGEAYRRLGERRRSHAAYQRYAELLSPAERPGFRVKLERLRWERPCAVALATRPGGAQVFIDGQLRGSTPVDGSPLNLALAGGRHQLEVWLRGHTPHWRSLDAEFGESQALSFALLPSSTSSEVPPTERRLARGPFVEALVGPVWADFGSDKLDVGVGAELGLTAGYTWQGAWLGIDVHGGALYAPVSDEIVNERAGFLVLVAGVSGRLMLWRQRLWLVVKADLGPSLLLGASAKSFLLRGGAGGSATPVSLVVRPAVGLGLELWRGLTVTLYPFCMDVGTRPTELGPLVGAVRRYQLAVGVGWQR